MGIRTAADRQPDKTAIVMVGSGATLKYRELSERADRYAHFFRQQGCNSGDSIAFTLDNSGEFFAI